MAHPFIFVVVKKKTQTYAGPIMPRYLAKVSQLSVTEAGPDTDLSSAKYKILEDRDSVLVSSRYSIPRTVRGTSKVFNI